MVGGRGARTRSSSLRLSRAAAAAARGTTGRGNHCALLLPTQPPSLPPSHFKNLLPIQVNGKVKRPQRPDDAARNAQLQALHEEIGKLIARCARCGRALVDATCDDCALLPPRCRRGRLHALVFGHTATRLDAHKQPHRAHPRLATTNNTTPMNRNDPQQHTIHHHHHHPHPTYLQPEEDQGAARRQARRQGRRAAGAAEAARPPGRAQGGVGRGAGEEGTKGGGKGGEGGRGESAAPPLELLDRARRVWPR